MKQIRLNIVVIGSGLASISFIDKYLEKKKDILKKTLIIID